MRYNLETFKRDIRIGSERALRDFFAPIVGLVRLLLKNANLAADRKINEALRERAPN